MHHSIVPLLSLSTGQHQRARKEKEENKKSLKIVMFSSQESRVNRSQDLRKEKEGSFKNLGLVAAQCNVFKGTMHTLL